MLYAMKDNRQYKITEEEKQKFIDKGYKIAELKNNKLVFQEPETKASKEIEKLKAENKALTVKLEEYKKVQEAEKDKKPKEEGK